MSRTAVNVTGDLTASALTERWVGGDGRSPVEAAAPADLAQATVPPAPPAPGGE